MRNIRKKIILLFVFILFIVFFFGLFLYSQDILFDLILIFEKFIEQHPIFALIVFVSISAISMLLGMISSIPIVPLAITAWGTTITMLLLLFGWLAGGSLSYLIGRYAGYPFVGMIVGRQKIEKWILKLESRMTFLLLLLFRLATPSETGYLFGIFRYNFWKYLLITFLSELPITFLIVYTSDAFVQNNWRLFTILFSSGIILILLVYYIFTRRFNT